MAALLLVRLVPVPEPWDPWTSLASFSKQTSAAQAGAGEAGETEGGETGAVASFIGLVRAQDEPDTAEAAAAAEAAEAPATSGASPGGQKDPVAFLTLEHYPGATERALEKLAAEAATRWPLTGALIEHRTGRVAAGEPIVLAAAASARRAPALAACTFLIERLKTDAPFWKLEERASGAQRWLSQAEQGPPS